MGKRKLLKIAAASVALGAFAFLTNTAQATFVKVDADNTGEKLYNPQEQKNANSFEVYVGGNNISYPHVQVDTIDNVDSAGGFATIVPSDNNTLSSIKFTPKQPELFSAFEFSAQLLEDGDITLTVLDNQGNGEQVFTFTQKANQNKDWKIQSFDGETIQWVLIENDGFKEVKQIEASFGVVPVPEPTTLIAGALLLLPFGASALRILRRKS